MSIDFDNISLRGLRRGLLTSAFWHQQLMHFIPKIFLAVTFAQWRPLVLLSCLLKWFSGCIKHIILSVCPLPEPVVGFQPGRQTMEMTETARKSFHNAQEWN